MGPVGDCPRSSHGRLRTLNRLKNMKDYISGAIRYTQKTAKADTVQDEEHLEILRELLNMEDTQLNNDERDSSTDLTNFNFNL